MSLIFLSQVYCVMLNGSNMTAYQVYKTLNSPESEKSSRPICINTTFPTLKFDLLKKYSNLNGIKLRAGIKEMEPEVIKISDNPLQISGYFHDVWSCLERTLNFSTTYVESVDSSWGERMKDGTWTGLIGMLIREEIDVAITGLSITRQRAEQVHFLPTLNVKKAHVYFRKLEPRQKIFSDPPLVKWELFVPLSFIVILATLSHYGILRITKNLKGDTLHNMQSLFLFNLYSFCQQGVPLGHYYNVNAGRLVLWITQLSGLIVFNVYSASLMSRLALQTKAPVFETLTELIQSRQYTIGGLRGSSSVDVIQKYADWNSISKVLAERKSLPIDDTSATERACKENFAFILLDDNIRAKPTCKLYSLVLSNVKDRVSIAVSKKLPYTPLLVHNLNMMRNFGVLDRLKKKWYKKSYATSSSYRNIKLKHVSTIFFGLVIGISASCLCLLVEWFVYRSKRKIILPQTLV